MPGYVPTPEDLRLWEVYGDWVHGNSGTHLDVGVANDSAWQTWWHDLAVMPSRRYDAPSGKVGRRFVGMLGAELQGVRDRRPPRDVSPPGSGNIWARRRSPLAVLGCFPLSPACTCIVPVSPVRACLVTPFSRPRRRFPLRGPPPSPWFVCVGRCWYVRVWGATLAHRARHR